MVVVLAEATGLGLFERVVCTHLLWTLVVDFMYNIHI